MITDSNGCTAESSLVVSSNANPIPTMTGDFGLCTGGSTDLATANEYITYQ